MEVAINGNNDAPLNTDELEIKNVPSSTSKAKSTEPTLRKK